MHFTQKTKSFTEEVLYAVNVRKNGRRTALLTKNEVAGIMSIDRIKNQSPAQKKRKKCSGKYR